VEILPLSYNEFKTFFLILIRVSVILFLFPFFSSRVIPVLTKAGLALIITVILYPVIDTALGAFPATLWGITRMVLSELIVGMILGLLVQLFFEGVRMMGQMVGFQTGFAITNILDPQSGMQVSILSRGTYFSRRLLCARSTSAPHTTGCYEGKF